MGNASVVFDGVWKKFRRGESHDSLRDLLPALARRLRGPGRTALGAQEFWALKDISFEVRPGETLAILGPNGAGKSSVLKLLTRILKQTRGECRVAGRVGALIEIGAGFHPDLTGRENVYFQGALIGMKRAEVARHFDEIVEFAGVGEFIDTPVKRYSSGMNARLGFSIIAHLHPDVLLVDEVLAVGDMAFQERCLERMRRFSKEGAAIVFVSHNLQAVAGLCKRALVLGRGANVFEGNLQPAFTAYLRAARDSSARYDAPAALVALGATEFRRLDGRDASDLEPHTPCELVVNLEALADLPEFNVGMEFERTKDLVYCYGATTTELGMGLLKLRRHQQLALRFRFAAHFARGHYRINVNVRDPRHATFLHYAESVVNFSVSELVSYDGIVDVGLQVAAV